MSDFHPVTREWFAKRFGAPTEPQRLGWPAIASGRDTLIAAPTGSGKTLAAFLSCIDRLMRQSLAGTLTEQTQVVYISPLKALSNDIQRNLESPLAELRELATQQGYNVADIRVMTRTGDTPAGERQRMVKKNPHILVTTPESLYILLTSDNGRRMLRHVRTVIVDEIHALARDKRGSHLCLSLERLDSLCETKPIRIGLSATQRPMDQIARFLIGNRPDNAQGDPDCAIVDAGHLRQLDLALEAPIAPLEAVCSKENWAEIYQRLCDLIQSHTSTLVFVNTRRLAERVGHHLTQLLGEGAVASHHGSLSREIRHSAEQRLKEGKLKAIVATASLELGIDIGYIDLVCQIGSPRGIATFLQRVGRAGHYLGGTPKGRLFPLTRDQMIECMALVRAIRQQSLDAIEIPVGPIDILCQQIVAEVAGQEWKEDDLFNLCQRAWPYRELQRPSFDRLLQMLNEGFASGQRITGWLHRDQIHGRLSARRGARLAAIGSGGAIPDKAEYRVVTIDDRTFIGTVDEDFAIDSMAGDIFQLGNNSWLICHVRGGEVVAKDAQGAPATIPFWFGEAPARTVELSAEISRLRAELDERIGTPDIEPGDDSDPIRFARSPAMAKVVEWLVQESGCNTWTAQQIVHYAAAQKAALGLLPTKERIVFERFFDESGGMQLVIHSPFGGRINRAWGLALRKRFCRSFDFELQAAADDNGVILSLGPQHSFPVEQLFSMLSPRNGEALLTQALLAVPMFGVRFRWNATRALAVLRMRNGKRTPPELLRFRSEDLLSAVFPQQTGCLENIVGDIPIPDHPLVQQTVHDCMTEAMDLQRWLGLLGEIEAGRVELVARDTREPSPFCYELLNANPYAFLDDAPLEERRTRAVATRRSLPIEDLRELGRLDTGAIEQVCVEAWPIVRDADELHDALMGMVVLPASEGAAWEPLFGRLVASGRACEAILETGRRFWLAAERTPVAKAVWPGAQWAPEVSLPAPLAQAVEPSDATTTFVRGRLEFSGPVTAQQLADDLVLRPSAVDAALERLEAEGFAMRGNFSSGAGPANGNWREAGKGLGEADESCGHSHGLPSAGYKTPHLTQWCQRRLLARIHRLTLQGARKRVRPVSPTVFWQFLFEWQCLAAGKQQTKRRGVRDVIKQLQGFEAPAGAWEADLIASRVGDYDPAWLDQLTLTGEVCWGRLTPPVKEETARPSGSGLTRVVPMSVMLREDLPWLLPANRSADSAPTPTAKSVLDVLQQHGALFVRDLQSATGLLPSQLRDCLSELAALGVVAADAYAAVRTLSSSNPSGGRRSQKQGATSAVASGRWSRFPGIVADVEPSDRLAKWAWLLLRRYGVVFRDLLTREAVAPTWGELASVLRRMEARGEILGGRFVSDVAGEQFAMTNVVDQLRAIRDRVPTAPFHVISAADPLNLVGVLTPDPKVAAVRSNAIAFQNGEPIAILQAGEITWKVQLPSETTLEVEKRLRMSALLSQRKGWARIGEIPQ